MSLMESSIISTLSAVLIILTSGPGVEQATGREGKYFSELHAYNYSVANYRYQVNSYSSESLTFFQSEIIDKYTVLTVHVIGLTHSRLYYL